jgi:cytochrome P450
MKRPPGPKPHFLTGNIPLARNNPLQTFQGWAREFGGIFYYRALWMRVYFVVDPDLIEAVLVRNYQNLLKDRVLRNSRWFFGDGLLTNEGESWLRQRRLAAPAFHRERIASYAKIMTDHAEEMLATWQGSINEDGEIRDIHQEMMQLTLRIVVRALFNVEAEQTEKISQTMNVLMRSTTGARMLLPPQFRYLPTPGMIEFRRAVRQVDETVYGIIARRREKESESETDSGDLLSMLMQARDEKDGGRMTDKQLRDEVMTFLLAGHETTALALSWTWHLLGENPDAEEKLHQELDRVLAGRAPTFSDLPALPYTESVIKESMRLYPPAWGLGRAVVKEFELGGYRVPAGVTVVASPYVTHRDPRFFPEPEKFDPDRWLPERAQKLPKFAYFPFGGGPRQCIGAAFAMMEAVLLLATIAQKFQFRAEPGHVVTPTPSFTLRPKNGIRMRLEKRTFPQVIAAIPQLIAPAQA